MTVRLIEVDGGFVQLIDAPVFGGLILHTIYVQPERRGSGVGKRLLAEVLAVARAEHAALLVAPVPDRDCPSTWKPGTGVTGLRRLAAGR